MKFTKFKIIVTLAWFHQQFCRLPGMDRFWLWDWLDYHPWFGEPEYD